MFLIWTFCKFISMYNINRVNAFDLKKLQMAYVKKTVKIDI